MTADHLCLPLESDDELAIVITSLSITSDALVKKTKRFPTSGTRQDKERHDKALAEYHLVNGIIGRARGLQAKRVS